MYRPYNVSIEYNANFMKIYRGIPVANVQYQFKNVKYLSYLIHFRYVHYKVSQYYIMITSRGYSEGFLSNKRKVTQNEVNNCNQLWDLIGKASISTIFKV